MPLFLVVLLVEALSSARFRAFYKDLAPKLARVSKLAAFMLTIAWITTVAVMFFFARSALDSWVMWAVVGGSYVAVFDLIWITGPALAGMRGLREHMPLITKVGMLGSGITFASSTWWAMQQPKLHGSMFSWKETGVHALAIVSGVLTVVLFLGAALPKIIDLLEARGFSAFVGARHVRSKKSGFLTVISLLSILGVALSCCTLVCVISVMGGFRHDLQRKILGNNAHIVIDRESAQTFGDYDEVLDTLRAIPGVVGATPVFHGEVMVSSSTNLAGVMVRGIDPESIGTVIDLVQNIEVGSFDYLTQTDVLADLPPDTVIAMSAKGEPYLKGPKIELPGDIDPEVKAALRVNDVRPGLIVGRELAKTLHLYVGDEVTLVSPMGDLGPMGILPRTRRFRVAAIFYSGMYEYDASHVYITNTEADDYFQLNGKINAIDVKVADAEQMDVYTPQVTAAVAGFPPIDGEEPLRVRDWREINKNLFSALKLEKFATFVLLSIAIMVASFCIVCTLLLMVTEKGKEIAILKALGATDGAILRTFMLEGVLIGLVGTVFGLATGLALCAGVQFFGLRLDPDVYYIDRLPVRVNAADSAFVALASVVICTLSTILPARSASRVRPVEGLRYE